MAERRTSAARKKPAGRKPVPKRAKAGSDVARSLGGKLGAVRLEIRVRTKMGRRQRTRRYQAEFDPLTSSRRSNRYKAKPTRGSLRGCSSAEPNRPSDVR